MSKIKIYSESKHELPTYAKDGDSGFDVPANIEHPIRLLPLERKLIPTGIYVEVEKGYELQVRPKSGNSLNKLFDVKLGTVDSNYRGEVGVIVQNVSGEHCLIKDGDFIAQFVIAPVAYPEREMVETLDELTSTDRGEGGFGSTGSNTDERKEVVEEQSDIKPRTTRKRSSKKENEDTV